MRILVLLGLPAGCLLLAGCCTPARLEGQPYKLDGPTANLPPEVALPVKGPAEGPQKLTTVEAGTGQAAEQCQLIQARNELLLEGLAMLAARLRDPLDTVKLRDVADSAACTAELTRLATRVDVLAKRAERYGAALQSVALKLGKEEMKDKILEGETAAVKTVEEEISKLKEREAQLEKVKADLENLQKELDKQIAKTEEILTELTGAETKLLNQEATIEAQRVKIADLEGQLARKPK